MSPNVSSTDVLVGRGFNVNINTILMCFSKSHGNPIPYRVALYVQAAEKYNGIRISDNVHERAVFTREMY